jgi:Arc/MetJ-type ribon-helix-helix transcriptional regulator
VETEKVCINLAAAELGKIDVLVAEGLFASRTDLIRAGIRSIIDSHDDAVRRVALPDARIGYQLVTRAELEVAKNTRRKLVIFVVGVLRFQASITPDLADEAIGKIRIFGALRGPDDVLKRIDDRVVRGSQNLER